MKVERKQRAVPSLVLFELTFGRDLKTFEPKEKKENHKEIKTVFGFGYS